MSRIFAAIADRLPRFGRRANPVWRESTPEEVAYWEGVIRARAAEGGFAPPEEDHSWVREQFDPPLPAQETMQLLDVGSGPFSTLGVAKPDSRTEIVATDALADIYNRLLDQVGLLAYPRIRPVKAEELSHVFGVETFHLVQCANALDHCEEPAKAFAEIVAVCRPGGLVRIVSFENEGQAQNYQGLHHWNLRADDAGLWLSDRKSRSSNLFEPFRRTMRFRWQYLEDAGRQFGRPVFEAFVHKHRAD
jgi:ubiquinone/menaquinone biosynthesis C-methylase UbiE